MIKCEFCAGEFQEWKIETNDEGDETKICPNCGAPSTFDSKQYAEDLEWEAIHITGKKV